MTEKELWKMNGCLDDLSNVAEQIKNQLGDKHFCIWLDGSMGAGKTTFTGYFLKKLGLPDVIPVTSPTFSYINEYVINGSLYAHLDLYRVEGNSFSPDELGLSEENIFKGILVEWPNKIPPTPVLKPTHHLKIETSQDLKSREYTLYEVN